MLLAVGTRVRLRNTGDLGVIREVLGNDLFTVYIGAADMEIPAFENNLERIDSKKENTAHFVLGKQAKAKPLRPDAEIQYKILSHKGILLAFQPIYDKEGSVESFDLFLINDTNLDVIYSFELHLQNRLILKNSQKIASTAINSLGSISFQLNDTPSIAFSCWKVSTFGTGEQLEKNFRIKPKNFFSKLTTAPLLHRQVHLYVLFSKLESPNKKAPKTGEDLSTYTKRNIRKSEQDLYGQLHSLYNVEEFSQFPQEIDLHISKLVDEPEKMHGKEILTLQLKHFDDFLDQAIRLGIDRCFVIHGIGKGKLKNAIAQRLQGNSDVHHFKNEYHHRYGWGATEIILKD